jgi:type IV pilus assembly protein PilN
MMLIDINLLPQKEQERPYPLIIVGVLILLTLLGWALLFFMAQAEERAQAQLIEDSAIIAAEQQVIREQIGATEGMNDEQQLKETVDWAESYQFDTAPLLAELVAVLPERGFFQSFSFTSPNIATLTLQFDTAREAAYYLAQLKTVETLASATLDSVTNQELSLIEEA